MARVNVRDYIEKNGASFYAKMLADQKKQIEKTEEKKAQLNEKVKKD